MEKTVENLIKILSDPNCANMNQSTVVGFLGELIVKKKLESEQNVASVEHHGNQKGFDLIVNLKSSKSYKIDVKTSKLKKGSFWDWSLRNVDESCDYYICIALDDHFKAYHYYVIPKTNREKFPNPPANYATVGKYLRINKNRNISDSFSDDSINAVNEGYALKLNGNNSISNAIIKFESS